MDVIRGLRLQTRRPSQLSEIAACSCAPALRCGRWAVPASPAGPTLPGWQAEHYFATKKLILDVRAAGSPRAYRMLRRKQILRLRSLALRGRAEPRDARMTFLVESPNEIAWKVLEYWRTELDC